MFAEESEALEGLEAAVGGAFAIGPFVVSGGVDDGGLEGVDEGFGVEEGGVAA